MKSYSDLTEASLRIRWARELGKFEILKMGGDLIETVDRETMMPLMLSKHNHAAYLEKHGLNNDQVAAAKVNRR